MNLGKLLSCFRPLFSSAKWNIHLSGSVSQGDFFVLNTVLPTAPVARKPGGLVSAVGPGPGQRSRSGQALRRRQEPFCLFVDCRRKRGTFTYFLQPEHFYQPISLYRRAAAAGRQLTPDPSQPNFSCGS